MNFLTDIQDVNPIIPQNGGNVCKITAIEYCTYETEQGSGEAMDITFVEQIAGTPSSRIRLFKPMTEEECQTDKDIKNMKADYSRIVSVFNSLINGGLKTEVLMAVSVSDEEKKQGITAASKNITFKGIIGLFLQQLPPNYNEITVTVKFIYDSKNNVSLPRYGSFISSQFHPRKFSYNPEHDFLTPQVKKEKKDNSGLAGGMPQPQMGAVPSTLF